MLNKIRKMFGCEVNCRYQQMEIPVPVFVDAKAKKLVPVNPLSGYTPVVSTHRGQDGKVVGHTTVFVQNMEGIKPGENNCIEFDIKKHCPTAAAGVVLSVTAKDIHELKLRGLNYNSTRTNRPAYDRIKKAFAENMQGGYLAIAKSTFQQEGTVKKCIEAFKAALQV